MSTVKDVDGYSDQDMEDALGFYATIEDLGSPFAPKKTLTKKQAKAAGIAVKARDTGRVLMLQRRENGPNDNVWEFPGGKMDGDEAPFEAAKREWQEEVGLPLPDGQVIDKWKTGVYRGFVYEIASEKQVDLLHRIDPHHDEALAWWKPKHVMDIPTLREQLDHNRVKDAIKFFPNATKADLFKGGSGSGNFGHSGRPGEVGGSGAGLQSLTASPKRTDTRPGANVTEQELLDRIRGFQPEKETPAKTETPLERLDYMAVAGPYGVEVYKTPGGVTVRFDKNAFTATYPSDEDRLRVIDTAEDLHTRFGQPKAVNVISPDTMRAMTGTMPWKPASFGASMLGGVMGAGGEESPLMLNVETLDKGNGDFRASSDRGSFMPSSQDADPAVYTITHETGHMVDQPANVRMGGAIVDPPVRLGSTQTALDTIEAGSSYGRGEFTADGRVIGVQNNDPEAFAESFVEYVLTKGQTTDKLTQAIAKSENWDMGLIL